MSRSLALLAITLVLGCGTGGDNGPGGGPPASPTGSASGGASGSGGSTGGPGGGTTGSPSGTSSGSGGSTSTGGGTSSAKHVVGYFAEWGVYARQYFVKNIKDSGSATKLTHINYAFANIGSDLKVAIGDSYADYDMFYDASKSVDGVADTWTTGALRGSFNQLKKLKAMVPGLKVLISVGGWTWSGNFSAMAMTASSRSAFAASCIDMFIKGNFASGLSYPGIFDGIDIDWEYPAAPGATSSYSPADTANFTALLAELRSQLDAQGAIDGKTYLLSIAAPAGEDKFTKIELSNIHPYLNHINLMSYDFHGAWETKTNFHSPLYGSTSDPAVALHYWTDYAVNAYLAAGVPPGKIHVGVPFYGRGWQGVSPGLAGDGLYQSGSGGAPGTYENGIEDYKKLKLLESTYATYTHPDTKAFYIFSASAGIWWSYDNPSSMTTKMNYIKSKSLGGAMFWELSGDDSSGTLISAISSGLGP